MRRLRKISEFDKKVYHAVLSIPIGQTRSYVWVARRIGSPGAARAVGNALNRNPLAPFVPCHRVVAADGRLGGYSRGVVVKKRILEQEREAGVSLKKVGP
jgi:methylated-DNA-[protein]-cysteine S-methyltransferase